MGKRVRARKRSRRVKEERSRNEAIRERGGREQRELASRREEGTMRDVGQGPRCHCRMVGPAGAAAVAAEAAVAAAAEVQPETTATGAPVVELFSGGC